MPFPVEDSRIVAAETGLGIRFSESHRARLRRDNGGQIAVLLAGQPWLRDLYPVLDDSDRKRLARSASHVLRETLSARKAEWFPAEAAAVAGRDGSCLILIDSDYLWSEPETGRVFDIDVVWEL